MTDPDQSRSKDCARPPLSAFIVPTATARAVTIALPRATDPRCLPMSSVRVSLAVRNAPQHHPGELHQLARGRDTAEFRTVRPLPARPDSDPVALSNEVLNRDMQVREHGLERLNVLLHPFRP